MSETFAPKSEAMNSPTFCVYPWVEQVVQTTGKIGYCCVAKGGGILKRDDGKDFRIGDNTLAEAWNSNHLRSIREAMLTGQKVSGCDLCYFQESIGKRSYREMHNEEWMNKAGPEIKERMRTGSAQNQTVDKPALYLDLRLGNLCNLKCRSCNPYNSSQIHREATKLIEIDPEYRDFWQKHNREKIPAPANAWYDSDQFWNEVIASIPNLRKVYLTGGEPTLIENNYRFLQACVESGYAKQIFLMFNVNGTNIQPRFLEVLKHFEFVLINVSIDGFGAVNEYIRHLSRWESVDRNFRSLLKAEGNIQIGVTPVIQSYNILYLTDLLDYIEERNAEASRSINVDFLYATDPSYLDVRHLPATVKAEAAQRLEAYKARSKTYKKNGFLENSVDSCLNLLRDTSVHADPEAMADFLRYTGILDRNRKQDFASVFPELADALQAWRMIKSSSVDSYSMS